MCDYDDRRDDDRHAEALDSGMIKRYSIHIGATAKVVGWNDEHKREVTAVVTIQSEWSLETACEPTFESFGLPWFEANCELENVSVHSNHIYPDWVDGEYLTNVQKRAESFNWDLDDYGQE